MMKRKAWIPVMAGMILVAARESAAIRTNAAPGLPTNLAQYVGDTPEWTILLVGGVTTDAEITVTARVSDPDLDPVKLEIEVLPIQTSFPSSNNVTYLSPSVPSGGKASVTHIYPDGSYHWRARTVDANSNRSSWQVFGSNGESEADFSVNLAGQGNLAVALFQSSTTIGPLLPGETTTGQVVLLALGADQGGGIVSAELEVRRLEEPLQDVATSRVDFSLTSAPGAVGATSPLNVEPGIYHWQARFMDRNSIYSAWMAFGLNPESAADFEIDRVPDGGGEGGVGSGGCSAGPAGGIGVMVIALLAAGVAVAAMRSTRA